MKLPKKLSSLLWSSNIHLLDKKKDSYYIIHQIFAYGSLEQIGWLFKNYSKDEMVDIFEKSFKDYTKQRFYFIKNIILNLKNWQFRQENYVKNIPRFIG